MICPVYIAEIASERWRGRLGTLFQLGIVTGIFLTLFINKLIQGMGDDNWNTVAGFPETKGRTLKEIERFWTARHRAPQPPL